MEQIQDKKYYTVGEIIYGLRDSYQTAQEYIQQMKDNISVSTDGPYESNLFFNLKYPNGREDARLYYSVGKKPGTSLGAFTREQLNRLAFSTYRWDLDHATFSLDDRDQEIHFKRVGTLYGNKFYDPKVFVSDGSYDEFSSFYQELLHSPLSSIPEFHTYINPYQELFIWGDGVKLCSQGENDRGVSISYQAKDDKIHIKSKIKYSTSFAEELLDTKIPKYVLPVEVLSILEGKELPYCGTFIDDFVGKRKEVLSLDQKIDSKTGKVKTLVLKKDSKH